MSLADALWQRFAGIERLYGVGSLARLAASHVCVIGIGGVGSWAAEALARSGVGRITLMDGDEVCVSNSNRQLHALEGNYGRCKVEASAERLRAINPLARVEADARFLTAAALAPMLDRGFDMVLDACDAWRVKVETIAWCRRRKLPLVVIGSAGGRSDPTLVRLRDLSRTEHDAMLSMVRKRLRQAFAFPRKRERYFGVPAVYSLENVLYPQADGGVSGMRPPGNKSRRLDCSGSLGAATHVTGAFAFAAVGHMLSRLTAADRDA